MLEYDLSVTTSSVDKFLDGDLDRVRSEEERAQLFEAIKAASYGLVEENIYRDAEVKAALKKCEYFLQYETVKEVLNKHNFTIAPTGCVFDKTERGFLPTLMETMYNDRVVWKKRMLEAKKAYEKTKTRELENEICSLLKRFNSTLLMVLCQISSFVGLITDSLSQSPNQVSFPFAGWNERLTSISTRH
jgi:hypothetical protein